MKIERSTETENGRGFGNVGGVGDEKGYGKILR